VLLIEEGRAIAAGAHGELRDRSEHYRRIFQASVG
jgi:ABC-type multidrug transport system fused ATPase/permease subunit